MPKDLNGAQTGMAPKNNVNNPRPNNIRGRNVFPQSYKMLTTDRYGEYSPFYWAKCERGDVQNLKTDHDLHTFTLLSPMVSDVKMTKSFIKVPMQAIYPINWEKMFTIPTQGDDIPADNRALLDVTSLSLHLFSNSTPTFGTTIKSFLLWELIFSHGSLFERFNIHFNARFDVSYDQVVLKNVSIDKVLDEIFWPEIIRLGKTCSLVKDGVSYFIKDDSNPSNGEFQPVIKKVSPRRYIEILRSNDFEFGSEWDDLNIDDFLPGFDIQPISFYQTIDIVDGSPVPDKFINIEPIIAYQLSCAQFGTNDHVDFIYSADLYRQNMLAFVTSSNSTVFGDRSVPFFLYNGVWTQYDVFSQRIFDLMIKRLSSSDISDIYSSLDFFINLLSYVPSLRYGDYFTGGKPQPLAVGEYSAEVVNGNVSAVDITRSIQMQRLLNRVNMVGRKLGDYLAGIFGGKLPEAPKDVPVFLAHQHFTINGFETENTGDRQFADGPQNANTITSHLRSSENRHSFEIEIDEPCYIIGMNSYESLRIYSRTIDRFAFHHDRYDDFIPEMQYIGDQDIKLSELDSSLNIHEPFAYCLRYMEYKQRYSYASGGFIENLPSWAFITDNSDGNPASNSIDPDYIRSSPSEFDRFYKSLTGYSLGSYFHFIVAHTNITEPVRMMEYTPEILK